MVKLRAFQCLMLNLDPWKWAVAPALTIYDVHSQARKCGTCTYTAGHSTVPPPPNTQRSIAGERPCKPLKRPGPQVSAGPYCGHMCAPETTLDEDGRMSTVPLKLQLN